MHIYQFLPYVLSTSFSTHPKRLTWDKKRPPFTFFGTMPLTGIFEKKFKKKLENFFSIFSFLRAFVVSSCRKSGFRVFLSLRYGADLGRSRLVFYKFCQISTFYLLSWCLEKELLFVPARFIPTFNVIYEVNCVLLKGKQKFDNIAQFPNFWRYIRTMLRFHFYGGGDSKKCALKCPSTLYPNFWRYIWSKLYFIEEEAEVRKYGVIKEFWRYTRSELRFTKEEVNFRLSVYC